VLLVRDDPHPPSGRAPLQVFLQRRVAGMAFAGGMTVFPGGGVDPSDRTDTSVWQGPDPAWWAEHLSCDVDLAEAFVQAAVRETFEESGVLLAGPGVPDHALMRQEREELVAHRRTLGQVLADAGMELRSDLLRPWSRWVTPPASPKRYDTAFLVAQIPEGQDADAQTTEAVEAAWWHPSEALEYWERGDIQLMAPTFRTLQEIAVHAESAAVLAAAEDRVVEAVIPRVRREGERVVVVLPHDPGFEFAADHLAPGARS
jgi:8-oxo-dGTP pyrophosphatase MutT (NUDIX family)